MPAAKKKVSKTKETIEVLRTIYGDKHIPSFPGSPHEGTEVDGAEIVLHELAHQTLLPKDFVFQPGRMGNAGQIVGDYIGLLPKWRQDVHEIKAVAIELVAARLLDLRLWNKRIIENSQINSALFKRGYWSYDRHLGRLYNRLIRRAMWTEGVQFRAETIVSLVERVREKGL